MILTVTEKFTFLLANQPNPAGQEKNVGRPETRTLLPNTVLVFEVGVSFVFAAVVRAFPLNKLIGQQKKELMYDRKSCSKSTAKK